MSKSGICLVSTQPIKVTYPIRCEIRFSRLPVAIPTVMQVRWVRKTAGMRKYKIGLQYLV